MLTRYPWRERCSRHLWAPWERPQTERSSCLRQRRSSWYMLWKTAKERSYQQTWAHSLGENDWFLNQFVGIPRRSFTVRFSCILEKGGLTSHHLRSAVRDHRLSKTLKSKKKRILLNPTKKIFCWTYSLVGKYCIPVLGIRIRTIV